MRQRSTFLLMACCVLLLSKARAQDPHFSQYFSSPLTFNPALTGYFDGSSRFAANIRNQWANISEPYTTGTVSFDTRIMQNHIAANDKWGVGVMALYDQSSGGIFKNTYLALSTGFNKGLDADGGQSIGIGIQACLARNSVDFSRLSFSNQFNGSGYELSLPSGETINNNSISFFDLNVGVQYNYRDENDNQFSLGGSMFHVLQPKLSYFSAGNQSLPRRYTIHGGVNLNSGENNQLFLSGHLMYQGGANEVVAGGAYGLGLGEADKYFYFGAWLRVKDAVYPYVAIRMPDYQVGLSYDITSSDLRVRKNFSGSSELSFIYFFNRNKSKGIPCFF